MHFVKYRVFHLKCNANEICIHFRIRKLCSFTMKHDGKYDSDSLERGKLGALLRTI